VKRKRGRTDRAGFQARRLWAPVRSGLFFVREGRKAGSVTPEKARALSHPRSSRQPDQRCATEWSCQPAAAQGIARAACAQAERRCSIFELRAGFGFRISDFGFVPFVPLATPAPDLRFTFHVLRARPALHAA
jgi:hypothetical protein